MKNSVYRKALKSKQKKIKKFGDDSKSDYPVEIHKNEHIGDLLGVYDVRLHKRGQEPGNKSEAFDLAGLYDGAYQAVELAMNARKGRGKFS